MDTVVFQQLASGTEGQQGQCWSMIEEVPAASSQGATECTPGAIMRIHRCRCCCCCWLRTTATHLSTLSGHQASSGALSAVPAGAASLINTWAECGVTLPASAAEHSARTAGSQPAQASDGAPWLSARLMAPNIAARGDWRVAGAAAWAMRGRCWGGQDRTANRAPADRSSICALRQMSESQGKDLPKAACFLACWARCGGGQHAASRMPTAPWPSEHV